MLNAHARIISVSLRYRRLLFAPKYKPFYDWASEKIFYIFISILSYITAWELSQSVGSVHNGQIFTSPGSTVVVHTAHTFPSPPPYSPPSSGQSGWNNAVLSHGGPQPQTPQTQAVANGAAASRDQPRTQGVSTTQAQGEYLEIDHYDRPQSSTYTSLSPYVEPDVPFTDPYHSYLQPISHGLSGNGQDQPPPYEENTSLKY